MAIKALCHMRVLIEPLRKRNAIVQCHRCQHVGHTAKYCRKGHICVKRADEHPAKDWTRPRNELCTCYSCGGQHPATYKGCSKPQAFMQRSRPRSGVAARTRALASRFLWRSNLSWYLLECWFISSNTFASFRSLCRVVFRTNHSQPVMSLATLFWLSYAKLQIWHPYFQFGAKICL